MAILYIHFKKNYLVLCVFCISIFIQTQHFSYVFCIYFNKILVMLCVFCKFIFIQIYIILLVFCWLYFDTILHYSICFLYIYFLYIFTLFNVYLAYILHTNLLSIIYFHTNTHSFHDILFIYFVTNLHYLICILYIYFYTYLHNFMCILYIYFYRNLRYFMCIRIYILKQIYTVLFVFCVFFFNTNLPYCMCAFCILILIQI